MCRTQERTKEKDKNISERKAKLQSVLLGIVTTGKHSKEPKIQMNMKPTKKDRVRER